MKKPKRFSGSLALLPLLLSMPFFNPLLWPNPVYGEGSQPVIGFTTQQMSVNGSQTLNAVGGAGCALGWSITSGGGSLSASTGSSVVYTAPSSNFNCTNNPTIALSCNGTQVATLGLAVNASADRATAFVQCQDDPFPILPNYPGNTSVCLTCYRCDGTPMLYTGSVCPGPLCWGTTSFCPSTPGACPDLIRGSPR